MTLSQQKLEYAALLAVAQLEDTNHVLVSANDVATLLNVISQNQAYTSLAHLRDCGLVEETSALAQDDWRITRQGRLEIQRLTANSKTFLSRLQANGFSWLQHPDAAKADLKASLPPKIQNGTGSRPAEATRHVPNITINNSVSPNQTVNTPSPPPQATSPYPRSSARAGWTNVALGVVAILVALAIYWASPAAGQ